MLPPKWRSFEVDGGFVPPVHTDYMASCTGLLQGMFCACAFVPQPGWAALEPWDFSSLSLLEVRVLCSLWPAQEMPFASF